MSLKSLNHFATPGPRLLDIRNEYTEKATIDSVNRGNSNRYTANWNQIILDLITLFIAAAQRGPGPPHS
jgi:hypothetical protein